jgi:ribonuclease R
LQWRAAQCGLHSLAIPEAPVPIDTQSILAFLSRQGYSPMRRKELARAMRVPDDEYGAFRSVLDRLVEEGRVSLGRGRRYVTAEQSGLFAGSIEIKRGGYGFFKSREPGTQDLFVPPDSLADAMDGDTVIARPANSRGRKIARVDKVVRHSRERVTGVFVSTGVGGIVLPDYRGLPEIEIAPMDTKGAQDGQKVVVQLTRFPAGGRPPAGKIVDVLGEAGTWEAERAAKIIEFGLRVEFPEDALRLAEGLSESIADAEAARRADYTEELVVAIDPDDARDHDDAIHVARRKGGGWLLRVHIADVSHYVNEGDAVDREARLRGTSVYLPGEVFHMLPERISANICSLVDGKRRLTKTVSITYAADGTRQSFTIERSIIKSMRTLTYANVRRALEGETVPDIAGPVLEMLTAARKLHELLRARRKAAGALDFVLPEVRVRLGEDGRVTEVVRAMQDFSNNMIEEFMLEANRAVGERCVDWGLPALHRIHEEPDPKSLEEFIDVAREMGLVVKGPPERQKLQAALDRTKNAEDHEVLAMALLRALKLARYFERSVPHYALAFDRYLHFTSPIRRYPDLLVHRALDAAFEAGTPGMPKKRPKGVGAVRDEQLAELAHLAEHCSLRERASARAEEALTRFRQLEFLHEHVGERAEGVVRKVDEYGISIELAVYWMMARAPVASLPADRYRFDQNRRVLKGRRWSYRAGERVTVKILEVDLVAGEVRVSVIATEPRASR